MRHSGGGRISIRNVTKVYDPDGAKVLAVDNCSLEIAAGEFCVVVGSLGLRQDDVAQRDRRLPFDHVGEITLDGQTMCTPTHTEPPSPTASWCSRTARCSRGRRCSTTSPTGPRCRAAHAAEARAQALDVLAELGLSPIADRYPGELSSGMKRRVEIARALINDPKVLLLDEPFRAMDALTKGVVQEFLLRALDKVRKTVLFITHDLEEALFLADRVVIMTTRPAKVKQTIEVDFPRPRTFRVRSSPRYLELKAQVFDAVHEEARKAFDAGERELA